ncbi:hypothetical protein Tco_0554607 [Tanacetum coccineum]
MSGEESAPQMTPVKSPHVVSSYKYLSSRKGEYTLWCKTHGTVPLNTDFMHLFVAWNKIGIDDLDIDDLYNNLKVFEADIKSSFGSSSNSQNVAFLSAEDINSINEVNTASSVSTCIQAIIYQDKLFINIYVSIAFLRGKKIYKEDAKKLHLLMEKTSTEIKEHDGDAGYRSRDNTRRTVTVETSNALVVQDNALIDLTQSLSSCLKSERLKLVVNQKNEVGYEEKIAVLDKIGLGYGDQLNESDSKVVNNVFDSHSSDGDDNQTNDRFKKGNEYHAVPPPRTGNYIPPLADLSFTGLDDSIYRPTTNKASASVSQVETSITLPSNTGIEMPRVESVRPSGVIIKDWVSDDNEDIFQSNDSQTTVKPRFKKIKFTKARNEPAKSDKQAVKPRMVTQSPKVNRKDWNGKMTPKLGLGFGSTKKAYFVCGSYSHLIKDCDFHEKIMAKKSILQSMGKNTGQRENRPV